MLAYAEIDHLKSYFAVDRYALRKASRHWVINSSTFRTMDLVAIAQGMVAGDTWLAYTHGNPYSMGGVDS